MIPRKKKRIVIIVTITVLLIIFTISFVLLYIHTDMFRSDATLFAKYLGKNVENIDAIYQKIGESEFNQLLQQNKYTSKTQVKMNYIEGKGTTSENTQNSINTLQLNIKGQTDKANEYDYQDIELVKDDNDLAKVEFIQNGNIYGIRFSDLFNQYIVANNENLKSLFQKMDYDEESLANLPDTIKFSKDLKQSFQLSIEEKQNLQANYINIFDLNVSKDKFSKQKGQTIQMAGKTINANVYILTLTKEQMNNIILKILEQLKQDEIILSRIDKIQMLLPIYQTNQNKDLRENFRTNIDNIIDKITRNNIGQEEAKILVYENNQTTIKTVLQNDDYEINIDLLPQDEQNYLQVSYQDTQNKKILTYQDTKNEININWKNTKDRNTTQYSLHIQQEMNQNKGMQNIVAEYEDGSNKIQTIVEQQIELVNKLEEVTINHENSINLSTLEKEQLESILQQVKDKLSEKITFIMTTHINKEDLWKVLKTLGLVEEEQDFEIVGVTETEKNRFNSKFEILQGEGLESSNILTLIEAIKENLAELEVVSNTELKLKVKRFEKNEEIAIMLSSFIEKNKNKKYNAKVEYDEQTGLVKDIVLTMLQESR